MYISGTIVFLALACCRFELAGVLPLLHAAATHILHRDWYVEAHVSAGRLQYIAKKSHNLLLHELAHLTVRLNDVLGQQCPLAVDRRRPPPDLSTGPVAQLRYEREVSGRNLLISSSFIVRGSVCISTS